MAIGDPVLLSDSSSRKPILEDRSKIIAPAKREETQRRGRSAGHSERLQSRVRGLTMYILFCSSTHSHVSLTFEVLGTVGRAMS